MSFGIRHGGDKYIGGYVIEHDPDAPGGKIEYDTFWCCHHGGHFEKELGKGPPAFCMMCMKPTCGMPECDDCITLEERLLAMEGKKILWRRMDKLKEQNFV